MAKRMSERVCLNPEDVLELLASMVHKLLITYQEDEAG